MNKLVLAVGTDLFFSAKIKEASQQSQVPVEFARQLETVLEKAKSLKPVLLILDLNSTRLDALSVVSAVRADAELNQLPILGFLSHVQGKLRQEALKTGCSQVLPRSEFSSRLPQILAEA